MIIAYLSNLFPAAVEPYVSDEIQELRRRGACVIACSVRRPKATKPESDTPEQPHATQSILYLQPLRPLNSCRAIALAIRRWRRIAPIFWRTIHGKESFARKRKAMLHTFLGAYYAVLLEGCGVDHIHVHHGYFASWIAMTAAALLDINYSMTLHGSDLFLNRAYLDAKLQGCKFCVTISEYNRKYVLRHFPNIAPQKISVLRLGVEVPTGTASSVRVGRRRDNQLQLLSVGRLHAVKDHAFLISACSQLHGRGVDFICEIAGDGPERQSLKLAIKENGLEGKVVLLGHMNSREICDLYQRAEIVVLTSRSEGIPLVLMEAMARGKLVLAPAITGIPELVIAGRTGFLYRPAELTNLVETLVFLNQLMRPRGAPFTRLDWIRHAARTHVLHNFNGRKNLELFSQIFLQLAAAS